MKTIVIFVFILTTCSVNAQTKTLHYDSARMRAPFNVCLILNDSATINNYYQTLRDIDTSNILSGLDWYYYDLSTNRYKAYMYLGDTAALSASIQLMERCYVINNQMHLALWHLGICHYFQGNCSQSLYYLNLYQSIVKTDREEKKQIKYIKKSKKCRN